MQNEENLNKFDNSNNINAKESDGKTLESSQNGTGNAVHLEASN